MCMGIMMTVVTPNSMTMFVAVKIAASAEEPRSNNIDDKAACGDQNYLVEMNCDWREEAHRRLITDDQSNHREHDGARISSKIADLPVPKTKRASLRAAAHR